MNANQPNYADGSENFAKTPPLQLTLRVMRAVYSNPRFWVGMAAVILMLTIMGPFHTLTEMNFASRLVYWAGISLFTFPVAMLASTYLSIRLADSGVPEALSRMLGGALAGIPIAGIVYLANVHFAETMTGSLSNAARMFTYTVPISAAISVVYYLIESTMRSHVANATETMPSSSKQELARPEPAFFKRLPKTLGTDIISLQAQDHYVKVTTVRGSEMILLRLADATQELAELDGTRVHRSWWVSRKHVCDLIRENDKWIAALTNDETVPVSRTYSKMVRQWFDE